MVEIRLCFFFATRINLIEAGAPLVSSESATPITLKEVHL